MQCLQHFLKCFREPVTLLYLRTLYMYIGAFTSIISINASVLFREGRANWTRTCVYTVYDDKGCTLMFGIIARAQLLYLAHCGMKRYVLVPQHNTLRQLSRHEQYMIFRLSTSHCRLRSHMKKIGIEESALYPLPLRTGSTHYSPRPVVMPYPQRRKEKHLTNSKFPRNSNRHTPDGTFNMTRTNRTLKKKISFIPNQLKSSGFPVTFQLPYTFKAIHF